MMIDFSAYIQSDWAWIVLFVMAIFVGMSKTGVQGQAILTVPMLAMTFGAKPSTGYFRLGMVNSIIALTLSPTESDTMIYTLNYTYFLFYRYS